MLNDFKAFITRGNVVELAVAVVIGVAFGGVVTAFTDLVTNLVAIPGSTSFSALEFTIGGGVFQYGVLINAVINFLIVAAVLFFVVVRPVNAIAARKAAAAGQAAPTTKDCPECLMEIPLAAAKCGHCASDLLPLARA